MPKPKTRLDMPVTTSRHYSGPCGGKVGNQYKKYMWHNTVLSTREGDNCVILRGGVVFIIKNIVCNSVGVYIVGVYFRRLQDAYTSPCRSKVFGISRVSQITARPVARNLDEVEWKGLLTPFKRRLDEFVVYPLRK